MAFEPAKWDIDHIDAEPLLKKIAGASYEAGMSVIFAALKHYPKQRPKLRFEKTPTIEAYMEKWVNSYCKGKSNRVFQRIGNPSGTVPDKLIIEMYERSHPEFSAEEVAKHVKAHTVMMKLENLAGVMLEEYLSKELTPFGWHCCWGQTMTAIDFCHNDGRVLQVKNSDNSENSSSSTVRIDTKILKWSRRVSRKGNVYYWDVLIQFTGNKDLSEDSFREFVCNVQEINPRCVYKDPPELF